MPVFSIAQYEILDRTLYLFCNFRLSIIIIIASLRLCSRRMIGIALSLLQNTNRKPCDGSRTSGVVLKINWGGAEIRLFQAQNYVTNNVTTSNQ